MPESNNQEKLDLLIEEVRHLRREIFYNRLAMAVFFIIALFYLHMEAKNVSDALGMFIEMFMPG